MAQEGTTHLVALPVGFLAAGTGRLWYLVPELLYNSALRTPPGAGMVATRSPRPPYGPFVGVPTQNVPRTERSGSLRGWSALESRSRGWGHDGRRNKPVEASIEAPTRVINVILTRRVLC